MKLKNGVSLFRIHRRPSAEPKPVSRVSNVSAPTTIGPLDNLDDFSSLSDDNNSSFCFSPSLRTSKRFAVLMSTDQSGSSEDATFDTDTAEDSVPPSPANPLYDPISPISIVDGLAEVIPEVNLPVVLLS